MPFNTNPPLVQTDAQRWRLEDWLIYDIPIGDGHTPLRIIVPRGFVTDFASVPPLLTWAVPRYGLHTRAAILHDFLYSRKGKCPRFVADAIFRQAMEDCKVPWLTRVVMYYAVRLFAGWAWRIR